MSKILERGQTGFGILIETDAGYVSSDLNPNLLTEGFALKPNEPVIINCILQKWGVENKNGRIYPKEVLVPEVEEYQKLVDTNSSVSEADHPDCVYASESEILTKDGWKMFKDISQNEMIQTLNIKTNKIEIQEIEKKIYENYKGKMLEFKSRNLDLTVTPNHKFLLEDNNGIRFYMPAQEIFEDIGGILSSGKNKILKKSEWIGKYIDKYTLSGVPNDYLGLRIKKELRKKYIKDISINSEDWFAFLGIYLADGHCSGVKLNNNSKGYDVCITQKKSKSKKIIKKLLNKLPFNYWEDTDFGGKTQFHISDARLYKYLFDFGDSHQKYIPNEIKNSSKDLLEIFFNWFKIGDGRSVKTKNNTYKNSVFSTSKKLIDDLQEILIKIGGSGNITSYQPKDRFIIDKKKIILENGDIEIIENKRMILSENSQLLYNLNISNTNYIWLDKRSIKINEIDFDDNIACVVVSNSNFMIRVNGKSHWTGNSSVVSLNNLSHLIKKIWWGEGEKENILYGQLEIITSPAYMREGIVCMIGDKIVEYLKRGIRLGISSRGVGSLKESNGKNIVQNDFELICFDLVASPSTPGAFLFPEKNEMQVGENVHGKSVMNDNNNENNLNTLSENNDKLIDAINKFLL